MPVPMQVGGYGERVFLQVDYPGIIANVDRDFISVGADGYFRRAEHISQAADFAQSGSIHIRSVEILVNCRLPMWVCRILRRPVDVICPKEICNFLGVPGVK